MPMARDLLTSAVALAVAGTSSRSRRTTSTQASSTRRSRVTSSRCRSWTARSSVASRRSSDASLTTRDDVMRRIVAGARVAVRTHGCCVSRVVASAAATWLRARIDSTWLRRRSVLDECACAGRGRREPLVTLRTGSALVIYQACLWSCYEHRRWWRDVWWRNAQTLNLLYVERQTVISVCSIWKPGSTGLCQSVSGSTAVRDDGCGCVNTSRSSARTVLYVVSVGGARILTFLCE